ncbi:MAG: serine hydrolase domain-containing protein [Gemmatimonadales bacterium]
MLRRLTVGLGLALGLASGLQAQASRGRLVARIDSAVTAAMVANHNVGVSIGVMRGGDLLVAKGFGLAELEHQVPATAETVYRIGSITKQFTATAILRLVEQGKLALDDEITRFLPDYHTQGKRVTIHHLLTHTSGIKSYTSLGPTFWNESSRLDLDDEQMIALFQDQPFDFEPGARYAYNNSAYYLLGAIIGKVTGMPYPQYLEREVLAPLGLEATSYCDNERVIPHRAEGYEVRGDTVFNDGPISMNTPGAAGAMCSTVLDLLAWQRASNEARLITPASRDRMRTVQVETGSSGGGYGYGLGIRSTGGHRQLAHSGGINGFSANLAYFPDDDLTIVVLTNNGGGRASQITAEIAKLILDDRQASGQ